jgi:DHA1 family multidrug resistance protein-like MFS transporter
VKAADWERNQRAVAAMVFVVFSGFAFVLPFLPLFVKELGVEDDESAAAWAGVLIGVAPLLAGLLAPVWGRLADRYGHKPMAVRALVSYVVLLALSSAVTSVGQLFALRAAIGLMGGIGPLGMAMATAGAPREHTGKAVGLIQAAQILSAAVGPLAGGVLADTIGVRRTFLVTAGLCALALVVLLRGYHEPLRAERLAEAAAPRTPFFQVLRLPFVAPLLVVLFLVNFVSRSFSPILPLHLATLGVDPARLAGATGLMIALYSLAAAASATLLGRAARQQSPVALLSASLLAGSACIAPLGIAPGYGPMLALAVVAGLASGGALTLCYTIGGLLAPHEQRGSAFGFFSAAALFGGAVAPAVAGVLAHLDLTAIFWVDAALYLGLAAALRFARVPEAVSHPARPEP